MITLEQVLTLKVGDIIHDEAKNKDGECLKRKVTSVKRWKRYPSRVLVGLKHGLYSYAKLNSIGHTNFDSVHLNNHYPPKPVYEKFVFDPTCALCEQEPETKHEH